MDETIKYLFEKYGQKVEGVDIDSFAAGANALQTEMRQFIKHQAHLMDTGPGLSKAVQCRIDGLFWVRDHLDYVFSGEAI